MRCVWILVLLFPIGCRPTTPDAAAAKYGLQVSNGLQFIGAVGIESQQLLTDLGLVPEGVRAATVRDVNKNQYGAAVLNRDKDVGFAVLFTEDHTIPFPKPHPCTPELEPGSQVAAQVFQEDGTNETLIGQFNDFRFSEGRVYLETDLETPKDYRGLGFFGPDGNLIGLQGFKLAPKLTYVMPIEYITTGRNALTTEVVGYLEACEAFAAKRQEATRHTEQLPPPLKFSDLVFEQMFSKTALVGFVSMLDKKDDPAHAKPVAWELEAVGSDQNGRVIAKGEIESSNWKWDNSAEVKDLTRNNLKQAFGDDWVATNFDPYDYGDYQYRIPFAPFCGQIKGTEVHNLTLNFADGRSTGKMGFSDMVNICMGEEPGQGTDLEIAWGLAPSDGASSAVQEGDSNDVGSKKKKKKRRKKKKKKKKKRRKRH